MSNASRCQALRAVNRFAVSLVKPLTNAGRASG
jgi:hypothetical protein